MSTLSRALSLVTVLVFPSVALTAVPAAAATPPFDLLTALRTAYQERGETVSFAGLTTMLDAPNVANAVTTTLE